MRQVTCQIVETRLDPDDWDHWIGMHSGPQIVVGGPGTGKTEFLVRRAADLIDNGVDPASIAVLGFSRRGAEAIGGRIQDRIGRTVGKVGASTFHSLALRVIETYGSHSPKMLTAPEQVARVAELLASEDPSRWAVPYRPILTSSRFAHEVTDFLLRCSEQKAEPEELEAAGRSDWIGLPAFMQRYRESIRADHRLDYGTLMTEATDLLADHGDQLGEQFPFVLVDEYQDTSRVQALFLQALTRRHGNLTASADPYQSVFSFRGTDIRNVERFPDDYGPSAQRLVLTTSFRVPAQILESAAALTIGLGIPGAAGPVTPAPGSGRVDVFRFEQATEEAEWIAREIEKTHVEQGTAYEQIAVFVRTKKRFMGELSRALERRSIPHNRPDSRLADHPVVRMVFDLVTAATTEGADRHRAVRRLALGPLLQSSPSQFLAWERTGDLESHLAGVEPNGPAVADLMSDSAWATKTAAADGLWHIWDSLPYAAMIANDPAATAERHGWASISQALARQFDRDPNVSLASYLAWTEKDDFEAEPLLSHRSDGSDQVTLTSLHQAKGLEFETIFIADAVEGVFPDLRARESLLGSRHVSRSLPTGVADYRRFRLQEETRLAYTAMTRASRRVVWTATSATQDFMPGGPSRFLALLGVEEARPGGEGLPISPAEAEAWLRRKAGDVTAPDGERRAAVENLARSGTWGGRPPNDLAGVARPGTNRGVNRPGQLQMSPSQADSYDSCPRRYALERRLRFTSGPSLYLEFGALIHEVIEATDRSHPQAGADDALGQLTARWEDSRFGGTPFADAWRLAAEDLLTHLYTSRNPAHETIALEHSVELDLAGVRWRGQVDRIEQRPDGAYVIDYKTGKSAVRKDEAAESIQLAFYAMAVDADDTLADEPVKGAELWYPRIKQQREPFARRHLNMALLDSVKERMVELAEAVAAEDWEPRPGDHCRNCAVRTSCPAMPEGQEAYSA